MLIDNKIEDRYVCPNCGQIFFGKDYCICPNDSCVNSGEITKKLYIFSDCFSYKNGKEGQIGGFTTLIVNSCFKLKDEVNIECEIKKAFSNTTNNYNELIGVLFGLDKIINDYDDYGHLELFDEINVISDSEYVIKGADSRMYKWKMNNWRNTSGAVKNKELWEKMYEFCIFLKKDLKVNLNFIHQKGHKGKSISKKDDPIIYFQEMCDTISQKTKNSIISNLK